MAVTRFKWHHLLIRFIIALLLVLATYNPETPYSYYYWAIHPLFGGDFGSFSVLKALVGLVLIIGWIIFISATQRSLGMLGTILIAAFFGLLFWLMIDMNWFELNNMRVVTYFILVALAMILAFGMSWSHIRRRMSGQMDVDEADIE
jgi:magnesium-transporting ATPase (P-type)